MNDRSRPALGASSSETPTPAELRKKVERTRDELGQTVEALAAKADIKARTKEKTAAMKQQTAEKASLIADQIREKAEQAARLVRDNTPDSVLDKTAQAAHRCGTARPAPDSTRRTRPPTRCWRRPAKPRRPHEATALRSWSPAL